MSSQNSKTINVYYSITDPFPAYRVDLTELVAVSLAAKGVDTTWYMAADAADGRAGARDFLGQRCRVPRGAGGGALGRLRGRLAYWLSDAGLMLRAAFGRYDVLQVRDKYLVAALALLLARLSGKRFVYWCSYPFPEHALQTAAERAGAARAVLAAKGWLATQLLYRVVMRYADHNFVQSEQMLLDLRRYGIPAARMTAVPMGVPQRLLDWAAGHSVAVVPGRVAYLGSMGAVRHLDMLIDAFALLRERCPQASLLMVGDGDVPHERAALEAQVARLGLQDSVCFTGFVPMEQAWSLAASAAVCVSPIHPTKLLAVASPTKLIEYMAMGRPVVCNEHPEQSSIIDASGAGLCVPWGAAHFAGAIGGLLARPEEAERMGAKGPAWAAADRSYPLIAERVLGQYRRLLA